MIKQPPQHEFVCIEKKKKETSWRVLRDRKEAKKRSRLCATKNRTTTVQHAEYEENQKEREEREETSETSK